MLFSTAVELMSEVVCGIRPSVIAAYHRKKQRQEIAVSIRALYRKLSGVEPAVNRALVHETAAEVVRHLERARAPLLADYRVKILVGNSLATTERRLKEVRTSAPGPLPGKALVVLKLDLRLLTDVFCCEHGHAKERSLLPQGTCSLLPPIYSLTSPIARPQGHYSNRLLEQSTSLPASEG